MTCKDCRYFHLLKDLKHSPMGSFWEYSSCCTLCPETEPQDGYDSFVIVVAPEDVCEMFSNRQEEPCTDTTAEEE